MFENKKTKVQGVHYSRYIMSWANVYGYYFPREEFEDWLRSEGCDEDEVHDIYEMAGMGKLELEMSARKFIAKCPTLLED